MTTSQKAALSLLISVLLFGGFVALTFTSLFDLIEARFYNPSITNSLTREISRNADAIDGFFTELQTRFSETLKESSIRHSFLPNQSADDIFERSRTCGLLIESIRGLQWIRFIDSGGTRIHFSTYGPDIIQQDRQSVSYRGYAEQDFPYEKIAAYDGEAPKFILDEQGDRILFSLPFYDSFEVYRGTTVFSVSIRAVVERLISEGRIKVGQDLSVISNPPGLLSGVSSAIEKALAQEVSSIWQEGGVKVARLYSPDSNVSFALISVKTPRGFFVGRLVDEVLFSFPLTMKIILLASFFLTVYLTIFLLFNLRQDSVTIVQNRLKQLQISLIEQYYERKGEVDWNRWSRELEQRRDEINGKLKQGIKVSSDTKNKDIDILIDKSWDELLSVIGGRKETTIDEVKLETILNRVLAALPAATAAQIITQPSSVPVVQPQAEETLDEIEEAEAVEELIEEAEPVEALEEVAASEETELAEALEEVTPAEEAEPIEALEEVVAAEEAEPVEALEEIAAVEEIKLEEVADDEASASEKASASEEAAGDFLPIEDISIESKADNEQLVYGEAAEELEELEEAESADEEYAAPSPDSDTEVPVIDMAEMDLSASLVNEVVQAFDSAEEIEEVEELGEAEDAGDPADSASRASAEEQKYPEITIEKLASQIEFSPVPEPDSAEEESFREDFEVVSPFATMLFDFEDREDSELQETAGEIHPAAPEQPDPAESSDGEETIQDREKKTKDENTEETDSGEEIEYLAAVDDEDSGEKGKSSNKLTETTLEEDKNINQKLYMISKTFLDASGNTDIETLEVLPNADEENESFNGKIIKEKEGIPYISKEALDRDSEPSVSIDKEFKNLVDSIIN